MSYVNVNCKWKIKLIIMNYKIHAGKGMETRNQLKDWGKVEGTGGWRRGCGQRGGCLGCVMEVERSRPWAGPGGLSMWEWQISLPPFLRLLLLNSLQPETTLHPTAFTEVSDDLYAYKSKKYFPVLILLDFSALCDTANHSLYLKLSLSLASKKTQSPYFPTSLAPVY